MFSKNFNWNATIRHFALCLSVFLLFLFFEKPICNLINKILVDRFLKEFSTSNLSLAALIGVAIIFFILFLKKIFFDKLYPSLSSVFNIATIFCIYFFVLRDNAFFHSTKVSKDSDLRYADLLFPLIFYLGLNFRSYRKLSYDATKERFAEDDAYKFVNKDVLGRSGFAKQIAEIISNSTSERAFAISVVGSWGSGKSVFMKFIENALDDSNEVLHFNPWKVSDLKTIFEDFFVSLSNKVRKYDNVAARSLKEYADYIIEVDDSIISKALRQSLKLSENNRSLEERFERLNQQIRQTGKRYVVFIDDIDRLTGAEVIQVLKLVRNTADFGNIFFIVAIDYSYVVKSMSNTKEVALESQYLQKIFQFELVLPPIRKDFIKDNFKKLIGFEVMQPHEKEEMERTIDYLVFDRSDFAVRMFPGVKFEGSLELAIDNLRDLVRYTNSLKISYGILKGEVDLHDLMVIELIKLRSILTYNFIGNFEILKEVNNTTPRRVEIDYEKFKQLIGDYEKDVELKRVKTLLDNLFGTLKKTMQTSRSINYPKNVEIYFHYQLFNQIPLKEFRELRKKPLAEILEKIRAWEAEGKGAAIAQLLQEMRDYESWEEFKKFIHLFLILGESPKFREWLIYVYGYFSTTQTIVNLFTVNDTPDVSQEMIELFLDELFLKDDITNYAKSEFASFFLEEYRRSERYPFKDKAYWLSKTNNALAAYLAKATEFTPLVYELFLNSTDHVEEESRKVVLDKEAGALVRDFILLHPDSYLKFVLRPYYSPPNEIWTFDPFIDQIFTSFDEFENLLLQSNGQDDEIVLAKKYLQQYKENTTQKGVIELDKRDFQKLMKAQEKRNSIYAH